MDTKFNEDFDVGGKEPETNSNLNDRAHLERLRAKVLEMSEHGIIPEKPTTVKKAGLPKLEGILKCYRKQQRDIPLSKTFPTYYRVPPW